MYRLERIKEEASRLNEQSKLALCVVVAKGLYPGYAQFHADHAYGDPQTLLRCISLGLERLGGKSSTQVEALRQALHDAAPDLDEHPSWLAPSALDACVACDAVLDCLDGKEGEATRRSIDVLMDALWRHHGLDLEHADFERLPLVAQTLDRLEAVMARLSAWDAEPLNVYLEDIAWTPFS